MKNAFYTILYCCIFCPFASKGQMGKTDIPKDNNALEGQLSNGLNYIVHRATSDQKTAEYRLVLQVGSICETDSEKGFSHYLEHMLFNGTDDFPHRTLVEQLQAKGLRLGRDINAYTSYDKTVYMLSVPERESSLLPLQVLENWLHKATLSADYIEKEKKIVQQEIRDYVNDDPFYDSKLSGTLFAKRLPIATEEDIRKIEAANLQAYYKKWYTPNRATVVVTGAVNPLEIQQQIHSLFSSIPTSVSRKSTVEFRPQTSTDLRIHKQSQRREHQLDLTFFTASNTRKKLENYKEEIAESLFKMLLQQRLQSRATTKGIQYQHAHYLADSYDSSFELRFTTKQQLYSQIENLAYALRQLHSHPIAPSELDFVKNKYSSRELKKSAADQAHFLADAYVDQAIYGDRYISSSYKASVLPSLIASITSTDLQNLSYRYLNQQPLLLYQEATPSLGLRHSKVINQLWKKGLSTSTTAFAFEIPLAPQNEAPKNYAAFTDFQPAISSDTVRMPIEKPYANLQLTELLLPNGIRIALKPTSDTATPLKLSLFSRGGLSTLSPEEAPYYQDMAAYLEWNTTAGMDADTLLDLSSEKEIACLINIESYYHEISASSFKGNLKDLLTLLVLKLQEQKPDFEAFTQYKEEQLAATAPLASARIPSLEIQRIIEDYKAKTPQLPHLSEREIVQVLNIDSVFSKFKTLFQPSKQLYGVLTGNFNPKDAAPALFEYLGGLAEQQTGEPKWSTTRAKNLGKTQLVVEDPKSQRVQTTLVLKAACEPSLQKAIEFHLLREFLELNFIAYSREESGLVYSPYVEVDYAMYPTPTVYYSIHFSSSAQDVSRLEQAALDIANSMKSSEMDSKRLDMLKKALWVNKNQALNLENADAWHDKIKENYLNYGQLDSFENYDTTLQEIGPKDLMKTAQQVFDTVNYGLFQVK